MKVSVIEKKLQNFQCFPVHIATTNSNCDRTTYHIMTNGSILFGKNMHTIINSGEDKLQSNKRYASWWMKCCLQMAKFICFLVHFVSFDIRSYGSQEYDNHNRPVQTFIPSGEVCTRLKATHCKWFDRSCVSFCGPIHSQTVFVPGNRIKILYRRYHHQKT